MSVEPPPFDCAAIDRVRQILERSDRSGDTRRKLTSESETPCPPVEELVMLETGRIHDSLGSAALRSHVLGCSRCTAYLLDLRRVQRGDNLRRRSRASFGSWLWWAVLLLATAGAVVWWLFVR
ncbi:MAG: hypothetical protein RL885_06300 [Planctomycetota bacterium]